MKPLSVGFRVLRVKGLRGLGVEGHDMGAPVPHVYPPPALNPTINPQTLKLFQALKDEYWASNPNSVSPSAPNPRTPPSG